MNPSSNVEHLQDEEMVKETLEHQTVLENERALWEDTFRQVERRCDPVQVGGFEQRTAGGPRGLDNFDSTASLALEKYEAAIGGLFFPESSRWHGLVAADPELNKLPEVQRYCEYVVDRLFALRYAPSAGFTMQAYMDVRMGGLYGVQPFWVDELGRGEGLFYRAHHASEVWIDEDFRGRVDTVHRKFSRTARQLRQQFPNSLSPKMQDALSGNKPLTSFDILHVVRPNASWTPGKWGQNGQPIESLYIAPAEKWILRHRGYETPPMLVSRTGGSPGDKYARSPAMRVLGSIKTANAMARTLLKGAHKAVDPPILFHDDGMINKFASMPGGMNPGMVDEMGRILAHPFQSGGQLPVGMEFLERERTDIKDAFLSAVFSLLYERGDRMTATEVLEIASKQGLLVAPVGARWTTEKGSPTVAREIDVGLRSGMILPPPPVMREAGAQLRVVYTNPMARMARAEEAAGFSRWVDELAKIAQFDPEVLDIVETEQAARGVAEVMGVRPSWIATPESVADKRARRAQAQQAAQQQAAFAEGAPAAAGAILDLAKAGQISGQAA